MISGVIVALVGFILVCIIFPHIIKDKNQYYAAFALVLIAILLETLTLVFPIPGFARVIGAINGFITVGAFVLLMLAAGGLRLRELAGDMARAYEVIRRGETEKTVIIPIGEQKERAATRAAEREGPPRQRYAIDEPTPSTPPPKQDGPIPLE